MEIITLKGKVKFPLTIDPSVWIFDDRKIDLNTYFAHNHANTAAGEDDIKNISQHWDKELLEGATPPGEKAEKKYVKEELLTGTYGISFNHFLKNAEPQPEVNTVVIETEDEEIELPFHKAEEAILKFSQDGKPLREDGPVHILFGDGTNIHEPIKRVRGFRLE